MLLLLYCIIYFDYDYLIVWLHYPFIFIIIINIHINIMVIIIILIIISIVMHHSGHVSQQPTTEKDLVMGMIQQAMVDLKALGHHGDIEHFQPLHPCSTTLSTQGSSSDQAHRKQQGSRLAYSALPTRTLPSDRARQSAQLVTIVVICVFF